MPSPHALADLEQGDILAVSAPPVPQIGAQGVGLLAAPTPSATYVVISQRCDIVRSPSSEPFVLMAPVVEVSEERWWLLRFGIRSARHFALHPTEIGTRKGLAAIDLTRVHQLNKATASRPQVLRQLPAERAWEFADLLGYRFSRRPKPDALEDAVLTPLENGVAGRVMDARTELRSSWPLHTISQALLAVREWRVGMLRLSERVVEITALSDAKTLRELPRGPAPEPRVLEQCIRTTFADVGHGWRVSLNYRLYEELPASEYRGMTPWLSETASLGAPVPQQERLFVP